MTLSAHATVFLRVRVVSDPPSYSRNIAHFCSRPIEYLARTLFEKQAFLQFCVPIETEAHNKTFWPKIDPQPSENVPRLVRMFKVVMALVSSPLYLVTLAIKAGLLFFSSYYREQYFVLVNYWEGKFISEINFSNSKLDEQKESHLGRFLEDPLSVISAHLDALDLTRLSTTCKRLRVVMISKTVWEHQPFLYGIPSNSNTHPKQLVKLKFYSVIDRCSDVFVNLMSVNRILYMDVNRGGKFYNPRGKLRADASKELPDYQVSRDPLFLEFEFSWTNHSQEQRELYAKIFERFSSSFNQNLKQELTHQTQNNFPRYYRLLVTSKHKEGHITFIIGSNQNTFETAWECDFKTFRSSYDGFKQDFRIWREKWFRLAKHLPKQSQIAL